MTSHRLLIIFHCFHSRILTYFVRSVCESCAIEACAIYTIAVVYSFANGILSQLSETVNLHCIYGIKKFALIILKPTKFIIHAFSMTSFGRRDKQMNHLLINFGKIFFRYKLQWNIRIEYQLLVVQSK